MFPSARILGISLLVLIGMFSVRGTYVSISEEMTDVGRPDSSKVNEQETMRPSRRVRTSKVSLCACKIKYQVLVRRIVYYVGEREDFLKLQESSVK